MGNMKLTLLLETSEKVTTNKYRLRRLSNKMDSRILFFAAFLVLVVDCAPNLDINDIENIKVHHDRQKRQDINLPFPTGSCCENVLVSSTGPANTEQKKRMGVYTFLRRDSNGKYTWVNERNEYLFASDKGNWLIGKDHSERRGWISHDKCKEYCPANCAQSWKYWDDTKGNWTSDTALSLSCTGPKCCKTMKISSTGLTRSFFPNSVLGTYEYDGDSNGKPSYKGPGGKFLQFSPSGEWMVSSKKNSEGGFLDSNCKADCPSLCESWKTFEPKKNCTPKCPWIEDASLKISCEAPTTRTKAKSACDLSFTKYPDASCILYDDDHCDASKGLIELTNGGMIDSIEERSGFDIESFSVREGCKLTMYKESDFTGDETTKLHATKGLTLSEDDPHIAKFNDNINSAKCSCEDKPVKQGPFNFLILNNKWL